MAGWKLMTPALRCNPAMYANESAFYEACALLPRSDPVHRAEADGFSPFRAITKHHEDLLNIERNSTGWLAAPRPALSQKPQDASRGDIPIRTLVQIDHLDHSSFHPGRQQLVPTGPPTGSRASGTDAGPTVDRPLRCPQPEMRSPSCTQSLTEVSDTGKDTV
jgi:hypothetical protein